MNYKILKNNYFSYNDYKIIPYRDEDKLDIKEWRNQQLDVLRQKKLLTDNDQINYYNNFILPSFSQIHPNIMLFSFFENSTCIGYGGLTNIDWESKRIELSFLINPERIKIEGLYEKDFSAFITLMKEVTFDELKFNRIYTETYSSRTFHISILEKNGFKLEGRMKEHILINDNFTDSLIHGYLKKDYYA